MTKEEIIKNIKKKISKYEIEHKEQLDCITENPIYYFEWRAERFYKSGYMAMFFKSVLNTLENKDDVDVETYITNIKDRYIYELTELKPIDSSSSRMANLCSLWITESKQEILKLLKIYLEN